MIFQSLRSLRISSRGAYCAIILLILIALIELSIIDTIAIHSQFIALTAAPAIGGVIAVFAGYLFTTWSEDEKEQRRKQFLARVFLSDLHKIQGFIAGIEAMNIKSDDFLITREPIIAGGILERNPLPEYNLDKYHMIVPYFHNNPHIRTTENSPLVSKKNPFEIFAQEIYSFEDSNLISSLFKVDTLMNEASDYLLNFHSTLGTGSGTAIAASRRRPPSTPCYTPA